MKPESGYHYSPNAKRLLDVLMKDAPREPKIDARRAPDGQEALRPTSAEVALFKSAIPEDSPLSPRGQMAIVPAGRKTEETGCDFIEATNLLLRALDCPPRVRHFVLCLVGLTGGDADKFHRFTDAQLSERLGIHRNTVGEYRQELYQWMRDKCTCVIEVTEKEFDRATMKYKPTEYRAVIIPYAAEFVKRARGMNRYMKRPDYAISNAVEDGAREIAEGIVGEMPLANLESIKRRDKRAVTGKAIPRIDYAERSALKRQQVLELVAEIRDLEYTRGVEFEEVMNTFLQAVYDAVNAQPMRYVLTN